MRISDWSSDVCSSDLWRRPAPSPCGRPADMTRRLSLFGATGSVGRSTLDLVRRDGERWCVTVLTANSDVAELAKLAQEFRPEIAVIADAAHYAALKDALAGTGVRSEEHTSELQSLMRISYAVFC